MYFYILRNTEYCVLCITSTQNGKHRKAYCASHLLKECLKNSSNKSPDYIQFGIPADARNLPSGEKVKE